MSHLADHQNLSVSDVDFTGHMSHLDQPSASGVDLSFAEDGQGFLGDWDLQTTADPSYIGLDEPDYSKFENWIPRFTRPETPCDYCRSRRLVCHLAAGEASCTSCSSLFRECSLTNSRTLEASNYIEDSNGKFLDTLHVVDEDAAKERGTFTRIKPLASKGGATATGSNTPTFTDDAPGSSKRNGIRFPRHAVKLLREWLESHPDHPYPSEAEKAELERRTELRPTQIANWLANARRRRKVTERTRPKSCQSPSLRPSTPAIDIPSRPDKPWDELNPFERWQNSPPENEPASIRDIAKAVADSDLPDDKSTSPSTVSRQRQRSSNGSGYSNFRAASITSKTSLETSVKSSSHSASSAAFSHGSSQSRGSFGSFNSRLAGKKERRRRRRPVQTAVRRLSDDKRRIFQCTFCTDAFKSKYDWTRHEKSLHLSLEKWICAPNGPVTITAGGVKTCVYCNAENPDEAHLEAHNHRQCEEKGSDARTFYRKDHLRQHLRLMHGCGMADEMEGWKAMAVNINSRCGFCAQRFTVWQERVDHLTAHFKAGSRMAEWKGCRGLDPAVAAQVTNAMPPYLIGIESVSPNPFSATNRGTWRQGPYNETAEKIHNSGIATREEPQGSSSKATCWEILTVRLGKYAHQAAREGLTLTDEMIQRQARRLMYESDDTWNQTAADNPEWLDLFKKAHGLGYVPSEIGGQGREVPEDLETYGDLGLRVPFAVQLEAYNKLHDASEAAAKEGKDTSPYRVALAKRRQEFHDSYERLVKDGLLHDEAHDCGHKECAQNTIDLSAIDGRNAPGPRHRRWCAYEIPREKAKLLSAVANHLLDQRISVLEANTPSDQPDEWESGEVWMTQEGNGSTGQQPMTQASALRSPPKASTATYLRHHRYEMPASSAHLFATTTGPWEDSGKMPPSQFGGTTTSTGAMMEFLGGELGTNLPFSTDATTSSIPLPEPSMEYSQQQQQQWNFSDMTGMDEATLMNDLEAFMASSGAVQPGASHNPNHHQRQQHQLPIGLIPDNENSWMEEAAAMPDFTMDDVNFDDLTFEGVFDIPMDE